MRIPTLKIKSLLESNPPKSKLLVGGLGVMLKGQIPRPIRNFQEIMSRAILVGIILVGRLGVSSSLQVLLFVKCEHPPDKGEVPNFLTRNPNPGVFPDKGAPNRRPPDEEEVSQMSASSRCRIPGFGDSESWGRMERSSILYPEDSDCADRAHAARQQAPEVLVRGL